MRYFWEELKQFLGERKKAIGAFLVAFIGAFLPPLLAGVGLAAALGAAFAAAGGTGAVVYILRNRDPLPNDEDYERHLADLRNAWLNNDMDEVTDSPRDSWGRVVVPPEVLGPLPGEIADQTA